MRRAASSGMTPDQFAQAVVEGGQVQMLVGEVARGKALAMVVESAKVTDSKGEVVDLADDEDEDGETVEASEARPRRPPTRKPRRPTRPPTRPDRRTVPRRGAGNCARNRPPAGGPDTAATAPSGR